MGKKYLYFQPEYVGKFKCNGAKCHARCCKGWTIDIDEASYKKYSALAEAQEIIPHIKFDSEKKKYSVTLSKDFSCPMLTENNLCRLQRDYGEDFLSVTCATYPRITFSFGNFFERSLTLTCPVAAELILFQKNPMEFKFVKVPEKVHSNGGKIGIGIFPVSEDILPLVVEIQIAMISILQTRRFSIDQRLIILGLFLDKLQELFANKADRNILMSLIEAYKSKKFLREEMPPLLQSFSLDTKNFMSMIMKFIGYTLPHLRGGGNQNFLGALEEVLEIKPDEKGLISIEEIIPYYEQLEEDRKAFLKKYSTVLENYLVNELFTSYFPWRFKEERITKNFAIFMISYKIFELIIFSATQKGLTSKKEILQLVDWFTEKTDHNKALYDNFFKLLKGIDDTFLLMSCLLRG